MTRRTPTFDTADFERSHGHAPRGTGMLAFSLNTSRKWNFSPSLPYAEARAWMRAQHPDATAFVVGP